jgi:hypothetical protein
MTNPNLPIEMREMYIAGRWRRTGHLMPLTDPSTGEHLCDVPRCAARGARPQRSSAAGC